MRLLRDYKMLFIAGAVLFGPSLILPLMTTGSEALAICNTTLLCTHGATPWGAATSIFLFDSWTNIPAYFGILATYVAFSDSVDQTERQRRARFASVTIFILAIAANVLWMHFLPWTHSYGPSGVVYALWGVLLAFTLFDGLPSHPKNFDVRLWYKDKKERSSALGNLMVFGFTAFMLASNPLAFLSAGPGVNIFAHGVSFLGGYSAAHLYRYRRLYTKTPI